MQDMETVKPTSGDSPAGEDPRAIVKVPTSQELYDFFNNFIGLWLRLPSQRIGNTEDDIPQLPNERGLMFIQPVTGILVIRTSEDFGKALVKLAETKDLHSDLFVEMVVLFWHKFVSKFWGLDSRTLPPVLFKRSLPKNWPDRKADVHLATLVLQQPIEIRLWTHLTPQDMDSWNPPKK